MKREPCPMAPLVEARRDGRLAARDVASLERHLATCASCASLHDQLARMAAQVKKPLGDPPTPLDHHRGRLALLRTAATAQSRARPRRRIGQMIVLAAAMVLVVHAIRSHRDPGAVSLARHLPPIAHLPELRAETIIRPGEGARFTKTELPGLTRLHLVEGALDLEVRKLGPDERFLVATGDGEVEVRGTIFRVEAHEDHLSRVTVTEGRVEVRHLESVALIPAGGAWIPGPPPAKPTAEKAAAKPPSPRPSVAPASPDGARDFAEALRLIERGEDVAAADKLRALRDANPADAHAEDAAYLAVLSLDRAGRAAEAREAARRFVALYPGSPRRRAMQVIADRP